MQSYDSPWLSACSAVILCHLVNDLPWDPVAQVRLLVAVREELQQDSNTNTLDGYLDAACVQVASFRICQAMSIALESILKSWTSSILFNCSCHRAASRHQAEVTRDPQDVCCIIEASHDQFYPEKCQ